MSQTLKKRVKFLTLFQLISALIRNNNISPLTDILQVINIQDSNKAHGHDMISICILKICGEAICRPLHKIFKTCLNIGTFPSEWKKGNVVPILNKNDKQNVKNYRPISLLPICCKILERIIYNVMYNFLSDINLFSKPVKIQIGWLLHQSTPFGS